MDYKPFKPGVKYDVVLDTKHEYNNVEIVNPIPGFVGLISTWNNGTKSINWVNTSHIVEMCEKRHPMYYWEIEDNKYCLRKDVFSPTEVDMNWEFVLYSDREECIKTMLKELVKQDPKKFVVVDEEDNPIWMWLTDEKTWCGSHGKLMQRYINLSKGAKSKRKGNGKN